MKGCEEGGAVAHLESYSTFGVSMNVYIGV